MKKVILLLTIGFLAVSGLFAQTYEGNGTWYETTAKNLYAKHANLPFGTRVRITNEENNKSVICTINGRIAQSDNQLVDVAQAAAENIGMNPTGSTKVKVEVLTRGADTSTTTAEAPKPAETPTVVVTPPVQKPAATPTPKPVVTPVQEPAKQQEPQATQPTQPAASSQPSGEATIIYPASSDGGKESTDNNNKNKEFSSIPGLILAMMSNNNNNNNGGGGTPVVTGPSYNNASPSGPSYNNANPSYNNGTSPSGPNNNNAPNNAPNNVNPAATSNPTTPISVPVTPGIGSTTSYYLVPSGNSYIAVPAGSMPQGGTSASTNSATTGTAPGNNISINIDMGKGKDQATSSVTPAPVQAAPAPAPVQSAPVTPAPAPEKPAPAKVNIPAPVVQNPAPEVRPPEPASVASLPSRAAETIRVIPGMPPAGSGKCYRVQVGAFSTMEGVNSAVERVQEAGFTAFYEKAGNLYRVVILHIPASQMQDTARRLQNVGFSEVWLRAE
jgi:cell division septation protein DedD